MTMLLTMIYEYFGFSENPFNPTPDPKYLFLTKSHQEALASMIYGIQGRKGFVCISGEIGTGKTTLIRHLLDTLPPSNKTVFVYQTLVSFEELLKEIVSELELPLGDQSKTYLIRQLNDYLIERLFHDETLVLFIDEAQHLSQKVLEDLRLLSNLETEQSKLLQMVLVGQAELEENLNAAELKQFKQRIGIWRRLKPLAGQESLDYIRHRVKLAGGTVEKVFTPEAASLICRRARGIPRTINILCDNALLIGYALSKQKIDVKVIKEVLDDMGMAEEEGEVDRKISDETVPKGQNVGSVLDDNPSSAFGKQGPCEDTLTPGRNRTLEDREVELTFTETPPSGLTQYRKPMFSALLALSLFLAGFFVKGALPGFSERIMPVHFRASSIQVSHLDRTEPVAQINRTVTVEKGETISSLAQKYYGLTNYTVMDHILTANPDIANPHYIREGQTIKLPEITEDSLIFRSGEGVYGIWLETFPNTEGAQSLKRGLSQAGRQIEIRSHRVSPVETWYRAIIGDFETREACITVIRGLKTKGVLSILKI